ncbi:MAG: quinone-interacting membrane-bound oxidoreductase complex subunit QmoC [Candidatus Methylomirabilales bacterium]
MATLSAVAPSTAFFEELRRRGGATAARCYQCATCSSVCGLAPEDAPFPRPQMLWAQWGLADRLAAHPAVWLCYQCNDCTRRCPRDARPGDVLQIVRALAIEGLAFPRVLGRLVGRAATAWPLLIGAPILFWVALLAGTGLLSVPKGPLVYGDFVPHWLIYAVFFPVAGWVGYASWVSGRRFWTLLGDGSPRSGSFLKHLMPVLAEIATHKRFASCEAARPRRFGHLFLLWGFIGAAITSGLLVVALYGFHTELPLPLEHPFKILGNVSGVLLVVGGVLLVRNRLIDGERAGTSTAFDTFFLTVVLAVIATGVLSEVGRFAFPAELACALYVVHLGVVLSLFLTFPYSKFAHLLYRTLALVHGRMTTPPAPAEG